MLSPLSAPKDKVREKLMETENVQLANLRHRDFWLRDRIDLKRPSRGAAKGINTRTALLPSFPFPLL